MRSVFRIACLLSVAALIATACNSGGEEKVAADAPVVKVLMIGYPDKDGLDPTTGNKVPGVGKLEEQFTAANSDVKLDIINIPWGAGATGYAPKTEAMIKTGEACLYEMPAAADYGRRGQLVNLDTMIDKDPSFKNVWGGQLDDARSWGPDDPKSLWYIPNNTGERVIHWDAKLFKDFGVEPLSESPTLEEIEEKAAEADRQQPGDRRGQLRLLVPGQVCGLAVHGDRPRARRQLGNLQPGRHPDRQLGHARIPRGARVVRQDGEVRSDGRARRRGHAAGVPRRTRTSSRSSPKAKRATSCSR